MEDVNHTPTAPLPVENAMSTATSAKLLTAEEYFELPDDGQQTELIRGVVVPMNMPGFRHGEVCGNIHFYLSTFVRQKRLGRTLTNDAGIVTKRKPDSVRGADVTFYSYTRVPAGESPIGYPSAVPEIVFEVVSPGNTSRQIEAKTAEYLSAGVNVVCVVDPAYKTVNLHFPDHPSKELEGDGLLAFADLPGFSLPVNKFFE
jgi:Uma2 family endonuclease